MEKKKLDLFAHVMVPKHRIMSDEEKEKLLKKYNISVQQLPRILINDPICRELKAKVGDVIEIERDSPTAGKAMYYRVVVME